jgi:hypothetical protein
MDGVTYEFRGRLASYKPGELALTAGAKKILAKTSAALKVAVNASDLDLAQDGDMISVRGWYTDQQRPNIGTMTPGYAAATSVTVALSKPLAGTKKARPTSSKPTRSAKPAAAPKPTEPPNPFAN